MTNRKNLSHNGKRAQGAIAQLIERLNGLSESPFLHGALTQMVECLHGMQDVSGSSPLCSIIPKLALRASFVISGLLKTASIVNKSADSNTSRLRGKGEEVSIDFGFRL